MKPLIVLLTGFPGTGKTTVARQIARSIKAVVLTTEVIRGQLFSESAILEDRDFTPSELKLIYKVISLLTRYLVDTGQSVIVDGVFRSNEQRQLIREVSSDTGARFLPIHVTCLESKVLSRLEERKKGGTLSPSGQIGYFKVKETFEYPDKSYSHIDTTNDDIETQISNLLGNYAL